MEEENHNSVVVDQIQPINEVVELGNKRKGRPPRAAPMKPKPPPKPLPIKDEDEDVCFICFDGGSLVLCDHRNCPKAYHPACIKRDEAFFESAARWNCGVDDNACKVTDGDTACYIPSLNRLGATVPSVSDYLVGIYVVYARRQHIICAIRVRIHFAKGEDGKVQADFDDKLSWEYLFKVYWVYIKGKLSLTLNELTEAKNPWKLAAPISSALPPTDVHNRGDNLASISATPVGDLEENESKRRKIDDQINAPHKETVNIEKLGNDANATTVGGGEWATKELLDFVAHMKNGSTAVLSRSDVQALMMEYINRNNLRDPKKKTQIICDSRLQSLFGKPSVSHSQMKKILEYHFFTAKEVSLVKVGSRKRIVNRTAVQEDADWTSDNKLTLGKDKKRRNRTEGEERALQNKLDEFAAVDVHNMNLIYLRRDLMEILLEDSENFHGKVVGSVVRIKISGCDLKHDMYRLVQVVGTSKVDIPYKINSKSTNVMLEVLNLDKKETISIETVSDQEFSQEECRRLQRSIRCGLVKHFTVGEIQEKAMALRSVKLNDWMEKEIVRLNQVRDIASGKGHKKGYPFETLLHAIPVVRSDPKMNPEYESDDTEEYFNKEDGDHMESKYSGDNSKNSRPLKKRAEELNDTDSKSSKDEKPTNIEDGSTKDDPVSTLSMSQHEANCNDSTITKLDHQTTSSSSVSNTPPKTIASSVPNTAPETIASSVPNTAPEIIAASLPNDLVWHYLDPNGKVQGPFSLVQLQRWSTTGYFPPDMRIWVSHEDKSQLLNDVLKDQLPNYDETLTAANKVNQIEDLNVCSAIPPSTVAATPCAPNPEKLSQSHGSLGQSFGQNWSANNNLNSSPPTVPLNTTYEADVEQAPTAVFDLPGPAPNKMVHEDERTQSVLDSKVSIPDSGNPPSWSSASSLVDGGVKFPLSGDQRGGSSSTPVKREEWIDSGLVSVSSFKPPEVVDHVATPTSNIDHNIHMSQPMGNDFTWHDMTEMIEFSTLAEESVSDLLAEVDAMESQYGLPSPTSKRNSFVDDLFGSFDEFSPTPDQGTRSDGFSSSGDIQLPSQSNTTVDEHLASFDFLKMSNGLQQHSFISAEMPTIPQRTNFEDMGFKWPDTERIPHEMIDINLSAKADGEEGEMETKTVDAQNNEKVENRNNIQPTAPLDTSQNHGGPEMNHGRVGGGIVQSLELTGEMKSAAALSHAKEGTPELTGEMKSAAALSHTKEGTQELTGEMKSAAALSHAKEGTPTQAPMSLGAKLVTRLAQMKGLEGTSNHMKAKEEKDDGCIQPEAPQPEQPLPPPPPPPPPLTLGLDPFDPSGLELETTNKSNHSEKPGQGTNTNRSKNIECDLTPSPSPKHRKSGVERNNSSNSPRTRSHQVEDSGYIRNTRSSMNKQSSLGNGSGGYIRPPSKGQQRVCRFYESGRCKKGASCKYLHQQP
ncbi:zinc finger CCCH domain-containing protein 44-like protein [Tanacetum coccineum]|uniref:Zinc finger CCCH domain-containing protein 44-like protein n=1 Tax=Tanacetum coccineum TaxID=301880 RepID=A0ABQ4ZPM0_9ASTR